MNDDDGLIRFGAELRLLDLHDELSLADGGAERFCLYRRRGIDPERAYKAALAWVRNMDEQRARRADHTTGYAS